MKLFLISQDQNNDYDTYDSAVVAAPDEETAKQMNPANGKPMGEWDKKYNSWCKVLSQGGECKCPLCDLDRLEALTTTSAEPVGEASGSAQG